MSINLQDTRQLKLLGAWGDEKKYGRIVYMRAKEELSRAFVYYLKLRTLNEQVEKEVFCNKDLAFSLRATNDKAKDPLEARVFHGMVIATAFSKAPVAVDPKAYEYTLTIAPKLHITSQVKRTRIHYKAKQTIPDVLEKVLKEYSIEHKIDVKNKALLAAETCKQFNETDFDFVHRLIADAGLFYFFKHEEGKHTMIISNKPASYLEVKGELKWEEETGHSEAEYGLSEVTTHYNSYIKDHEIKAFTHAKSEQLVEKSHAAKFHTKQEAPPAVKNQRMVYMQQAEDVTEVQAMIENTAIEGDGPHVPESIEATGGYRGLFVGGKVKFAGKHLDAALATKEYTITELELSAWEGEEPGIRSWFRAIPKDCVLLPLRRPHELCGPHPALVVGKDGKDEPEEPLIDKKGHCYTYVKLLWGGDHICRALVFSTFNATNTPKAGALVSVWFMKNEGYADVPFIFGMYTPKMSDLVDYEEKDHNTWALYSAFHTDKEKDFFNSILFKDKKDKAEIEVRAKKDMYSYVTNMRQAFIGVDKREDVEEKEEDDKEILVVKKGNKREIICEGNSTLNVNKGDILIKVKKGNYTLEVKQKVTVQADDDVSFTTKKDFKIAANQKVIIEGKQGVEITSGADLKAEAKIGASIEGTTFAIKGKAMGEVKAAMVKINS